MTGVQTCALPIFSMNENNPVFKLCSSNNALKVNPFEAYYKPSLETGYEELLIEIDNTILSVDNINENIYEVSNELYSIDGIKQNNNECKSGLFISVIRMSDGTIRTIKIYR